MDPTSLQLIDQDISRALGNPGNPSIFNAAEAIIVTYNNIPKYRESTKRFTFQVVIATDYTNTFAILNYDRLDESGNDIGYSDPSCNSLKYFTRSPDKRVLARTSNVGVPGKHIHLLTSKGCSGKYLFVNILQNCTDIIGRIYGHFKYSAC